MAKLAICIHCGMTKRGHDKANTANLWYCRVGHKLFTPQPAIMDRYDAIERAAQPTS